ncbi:class I SAM-dependent methyltransferase [Xylanimonas ulmi]|uniref:Methyltransferase family protein n=1 Tax=Xylanimonas ulmi TaxID=228973 RepID=A0A4Q7LXW9_9MICO|nr:class I SAM-dependent methyltransferase [Xylanibacterium ulmi]RZS59945.1 methyltransferase family protein [Xylanibacterium ulmi]
MSHYQTVVDLTVRNSSQTLEVEMVGTGKRVLDVGCAGGFLADALNLQGCTVSGVEYDADAAQEARPKLRRLEIADIEKSPLAELFRGDEFDRIVFGDVLEHLRDPAAVLRSAMELLPPDGRIVISVPNVAHGSLRLALLQGRWRYRDTGLLDRTHITFFTLESLVAMLTSLGLVIHDAWSPQLDVLGTEVEVAPDTFPGGLVDWVRHQPRALDYQYVVSVGVGEPTGELPDVKPAATWEEIVPDDRFAQEARDRVAGEHARMYQRDHVMGLEAGLARAELTYADAAARAKAEYADAVEQANAKLERARATVDEIQAERERLSRLVEDLDSQSKELRASTTWRIGSLVMAPLRFVKRARR